MTVNRDTLLSVLDEFSCASIHKITIHYSNKSGRNYVSEDEIKREIRKIRKEYRDGVILYTIPHVGGQYGHRIYFVSYPFQRVNKDKHLSMQLGRHNSLRQAYVQLLHEFNVMKDAIERGQWAEKDSERLKKRLTRHNTDLERLGEELIVTHTQISDIIRKEVA